MKVVNKAVKTVKQSKMFTVYSLRLVFRCLVFLFIAAMNCSSLRPESAEVHIAECALLLDWLLRSRKYWKIKL